MPQLKVDDLAELPLFYAYCLATGWGPTGVKGKNREVVKHSDAEPIAYVSHGSNPFSAVELAPFYYRSYDSDAFWGKMCETGLFPVKLADCQETGQPQYSIENGGFKTVGSNALVVFQKAMIKFANKSEMVDIPDSIWRKYQDLLQQRQKHQAHLEECRHKIDLNDLSP